MMVKYVVWLEDEKWNMGNYTCSTCKDSNEFEIQKNNYKLPYVLEVKCLNCKQVSHAKSKDPKTWVKFIEIE